MITDEKKADLICEIISLIRKCSFKLFSLTLIVKNPEEGDSKKTFFYDNSQRSFFVMMIEINDYLEDESWVETAKGIEFCLMSNVNHEGPSIHGEGRI